jgi:ubiquinol-cytochrome c reductase cytochrome b subunit
MSRRPQDRAPHAAGAFLMKVLAAIWQWIEHRTGIAGIIKPLANHLVPPGSKWWYVFGSAALFSFLVQLATGAALATVYIPSSGQAYNSLLYITHEAPFGSILRGMHFFGASAMILFAGVHLIRVYLMAAYKYPRELNWVSGVLLLGLAVATGFTGQVLRWDQNAIWSAVVGAEQAARTPFIGKTLAHLFFFGDTLGSALLSHFFALHVFVFPGLIIAVLGLHLHLVLKNGVSEPPVAGRPVDPATYRAWYQEMLNKIGLPFWPHAAFRDVAFGVAVVAGIAILAVAIGPPVLDKPPDPSIIEALPRPDWYLLPYFAVLALLPHHAEDYVILLAPLLVGLVLLAVPFVSNRGERIWTRRPWAPVIVVFVLTCVGVLWNAGVQEPWSPKFDARPLTEAVIGTASGPVYDGAMVFNTKGCLYCHSISGHGGRRGPNLTYVGDRLTRDQIVIRINKGGYNMPGYANDITSKQLEDVTTFLLSRKAP